MRLIDLSYDVPLSRIKTYSRKYARGQEIGIERSHLNAPILVGSFVEQPLYEWRIEFFATKLIAGFLRDFYTAQVARSISGLPQTLCLDDSRQVLPSLGSRVASPDYPLQVVEGKTFYVCRFKVFITELDFGDFSVQGRQLVSLKLEELE